MMKNFSMSSFVAGVMLGALLVGAWFFDSGSLFTTPPSSLTTNTQNNVLVSDSVVVKDQPAGDTVMIESVTVPPPGVWIAVREMNGSERGNVLGAARVRGPRSDVPVSLLRGTEPGRVYVVELYRDDNNDAFDPLVNSAYVDFDTGVRVAASFTTTQ